MTSHHDQSEPDTRSGRLPALVLPFGALFVVSGACGLTYEVVWSRYLAHVFGVTAFAVSTVLVSFMGGMALGAALLGRRADRAARPLRMFALLEAGIGLYALLLPFLLHGADLFYEAIYPVVADSLFLRSLIRFVFSLVLLLVPTVLMGGTLPALGRGLLQRSGKVGLGIGLLYFLNTLGASFGCFLAGFSLIPAFGLRATTFFAAALNGAVALIAWILDRRAPADDETRAVEPPKPVGAGGPLTSPSWWPLAVAFGSGASALAFEVVWFRVLVLSFGSTVYSFSAMLAVFLLGLAVGAAILGPAADRVRHPVRLLVLTQGGVALFAVLGSLAVNYMPALFLRVIQIAGLDFDGMNRTKIVLSTLTLFPPALAFGGTFPVAVRLFSGRESGTGSRIGRVYAWNTLGAILGSFGAGFLLLPTIGSEWTLRLVVGLSLSLAFGSILAEAGPLRLRWASSAGLVLVLVAGLLFFAPPWDRRLLGAGVYFEPQNYITEDGRIALTPVVSDYRVTTFTEGYNDTIISFESPMGKFITVNGSATASDHFEDMFCQRMLGHVPVALHPGPVRKACIVGLGAGVTAGAIAVHEIDELVVVELEEGVFEASRFFEEQNHHVLDRPAVKIRIDDGRNYLKLTEETFDVISSHPNFPSLTGSGTLFSRDFLDLARSRLNPGGVMCQFVPTWRLLPEDVKTIVGTFGDAFPHVRVFSFGLNLILLGREEPFPPVDIEELSRRLGRTEVRESLAEVGIRGPVELLSFYQFDEDELPRYASAVPRNTDDRPVTEFRAPRGLFSSTVGPNLEAIALVRPPKEERLARLGLKGDYGSSYLILAAGYDATTDAQILVSRGRIADALSLAIPVADSGARYAAYVLADQYENLGKQYQHQGNLEAARKMFSEAVHYEPGRLDARLGLANADLFLGYLDEAEAVLVETVQRYPRSAPGLTRLGLVRELQGRLAEAAELYEAAVRAKPESGEAHAFLGRLQHETGYSALALEHLETAYALGDRTEGAMVALGEALLVEGRSEEAFGIAREMAEWFPGSVEVQDLLVRAAAASGRAVPAVSE